jgi:hypothetical protein
MDPSTKVVVLGDFNEYQMVEPLRILLRSLSLIDLMDTFILNLLKKDTVTIFRVTPR